MLVRRTEAGPDRVRRARATWSGPGGRSTRRRASVCGITLPAGCARPTGCPSRSSRPSTKAETGHDDQHQRGRGRPARRPDLIARLKDCRSSVYATRRGARRIAGHHRRRHEVRVRRRARRRGGEQRPAHRRGADARLVALLAGGRRTSRAAASRASTSSTCATTSSRSAGTSSRRCPSLPDEVVARTREKYVEALRRLTGHDLD